MTTKPLTEKEIEGFLDEFLDGYFDYAIDHIHTVLDEDSRFDRSHFTDDALAQAHADAIEFLTSVGSNGRVADIMRKTSRRIAGRDFWLARNEKGDFEPSDWGQFAADLLTKAAKSMGPCIPGLYDEETLEWFPCGTRGSAPTRSTTGPSAADIETINTYRRTMGMGKLDQAAAGYSNEELAEMAANIRKYGRTVANPSHLKRRLMR